MPEECVSDAYWRVWNSVPPQQPRSLKCYLGRIVRNLSLNRYDYRHAEKRSGEFQLLLSEVEEWLPDAAGEAAFEEGEILTAIREYLIALPEGERALFVRRYWHTESIAALAERFGLSQGRVTRVLFRLRRRSARPPGGKGDFHMKKEQLYTLFGGIDDELVEQAEAYKPPARRKWAVRLLPAAACLALAAGTALFLPRLLEPAAPPFQGATYSSLEDIPVERSGNNWLDGPGGGPVHLWESGGQSVFFLYHPLGGG